MWRKALKHSNVHTVFSNFITLTVTVDFDKVDKHIRKLDADLARFEADLKDKSLGKPKSDDKPETGKKSSVYITCSAVYISLYHAPCIARQN